MLTSLFRAIILIGILILSIWFAFYVLTVGLLIGVVFGGYAFLRRILVEKGIITPSARPRYQSPYGKSRHKPSAQSAQIINVEYHEVSVDESEDPRTNAKH